MLSSTVEYALRATLYIARKSPRAVRLREVADAVNAPPRYLAKILSTLAREGLLESSRGPTGGFRLAPRRQHASFRSIAAVFEAAEPRRCLLGDGVCGRIPDCPVHDRWAPIAGMITEFFSETTVSALMSPRTPS